MWTRIFLLKFYIEGMKQTKEKKMKKTNVQVVEQKTSILQVIGGLFILFAIADFALSWMGTNLTGFMGPASRFSPIVFGLIGSVLMNSGKEGG